MRTVDEIDRELAMLADLRGFLNAQMPGGRVSTTHVNKLLDERRRTTGDMQDDE